MGYVGELRQLNVAHRCRQTGCFCPKEQVSLFLKAVWAAVPWTKERREVSRVIWRFSNSENGVRGLAWAWRRHGRNIVTGSFLVKFWRYCGCLNQVGDRKGVCMVWRNHGLGRIWKTLWIPKIAVCLDSDLLSSARISFLPPFYPFSRLPFGAHRSPFSIFTSFSHNYILLSKKPCSPPAKSLSLLVTFLHWSVLDGWGGEAAPNQAALETLARSWAGLLPYCLVKEWQARLSTAARY